ncbi:MAG TPA: hypothetical protein VEZ47_01595 [Gemmatirosa sp.]|nr:hypothetical protein [Gemmatirosa sp.]
MAEIRVEPKRRSLAWLWTLLALALVALVAWYLMNGGVRTVDDDNTTTTTPAGATSSALPVPAPALA